MAVINLEAIDVTENLANSRLDFDDQGSGNTILSIQDGGPFDLSGSAQNLRLATGQAIEDGSGTNRITIDGSATQLYDQDGDQILNGFGGASYDLSAYSDTDLRIFDQEFGGAAVTYSTSASAPGTLELTNADLDLSNNKITTLSVMSWEDAGANDSVFQNITDSTGLYWQQAGPAVVNEEFLRFTFDGPVELPNHNLRLATGQAIEDGSGNDRFVLGSTNTAIRTETGGIGARISTDASLPRFRVETFAGGGNGFDVFDNGFSDVAFQYIPSGSAPGTLELTNANLDILNPTNTGEALDVGGRANFDDQISIWGKTAGRSIVVKSDGDLLFNVGGGTNENRIAWPDQGGGQESRISQNGAGEIVAEDDNGNQTTLT